MNRQEKDSFYLMNVSDSWLPTQYERFRDQRDQPAHDLIDLVKVKASMRVLDLGCGTGRLTAELHSRVNAAETIGIDSSHAMLSEASQYASATIRFVHRDIAEFDDKQHFDLIFANASLQWVDDHKSLFARLRELLLPNGQIAIQVPANEDHISHTTAARVAASEPFRSKLEGYVRTTPVVKPEEYSELLHKLGFSKQHVRLQIYPTLLSSGRDVVEWVKGSLLTDYRKRLSEPDYAHFLSESTFIDTDSRE